MSLSTLVLGLLNGLTIGLLAVGLVLVYKSNRFLNVAHAQVGTLPAGLLAKWVLDWGWSWWIAATAAVVVGVGVGLGVERFLIGPLRRRGGTPVQLLLLSVAISQLLLAFTFVPALAPSQASRAMPYPQPFDSNLRIGGVVLTGMSVLIAIVVPLLVVGLAAFLRWSLLGKSIRAAANNRDAARLCGISVARVSAVTWGCAGALATVSAIFQAPTMPGFNLVTFGPYLLMVTLGAAAFGAFVSLPAALGGGVVLGLVSQIVSAQTSNASTAELAVFLTILAVVFARGRAMARVFALSGGVGRSRPPLAVPARLRSSPLVRHQGAWLGGAAVLAAVALPNLPYLNTSGHQFLLVLVLLYALLGVSLTVVVGWAGQVPLGHFALVGLAAYLTTRWAADWSVTTILVVVGLLGALVMAGIGLPALRVGGLALPVTTMGFAVVAVDWLYRQDWVGSGQTFATVAPMRLGPHLGTADDPRSVYYVALLVLVLGAAGAAGLRRWGPARLAIAVRDNDLAASSFGVNPAAVKLAFLAVSGFYAAAAGVLWAYAWRVVSTDQFTANVSISVIAIPVIGGLGSVAGAITAAVVLYASTFFIGPSVAPLFGEFGQNLGFQLFLAGTGQVMVLMKYPHGIAGAVQTRWERYLRRRAEEIGAVTAVEPLAASAASVASVASVAPLAPITSVASVGREEGSPGGAPHDGELPLVARDIHVHFGGVVALDGVDIEVRAGEIVGLIGPNGAGKTTLMHVISGVQRTGTGSVRIRGHEVSDLSADFRAPFGLARTFQDARLFGGLTVTETIQVAMAYRLKVGLLAGATAAPWARATECLSRARAQEIVERFGLGAWADTLTADLSTGSRRICDLAAQLAAQPMLLLLDEPTAGVAQREAEAFGPLLRRIRDELDCAVLIVEHDMPLLMGLCDRVYAMEAGRVIAEGTAEEIRHDRAVVASYLGSNTVTIERSGPNRGARSRAGTVGSGVPR